jgi:sulfur-oxidizing protein SoxZ
MRVRATENGGVVDVKILMKHDMETGQRKDASGKTIPAWHIQTVIATCKGKEVFHAQFGPAVSKDPFLNFSSRAVPRRQGHRDSVDNRGDKRTDEATIA